MAGLLLAGVGAAIGLSIGGTFLGISAVVIGQTIGSVIGTAIDNFLFAPTLKSTQEGPRLNEANVMTSVEGTNIYRGYGRFKVAGNVIWATRLREEVVKETTKTGGKGGGGGSEVTTTTYNYYANFAVGLCEGEILDVHRVWADGKLLDLSDYTYRIYKGTETQNPDSLIETKEGSGNAPGYRGLAYIIFEDMQINKFGNRIPQMTFEITKPITRSDNDAVGDLITGIDLIPGTTEFGYDPREIDQVIYEGSDIVERRVENNHTGDGKSDWEHALDQMEVNLPNCNIVTFVVTWFGDDLRIGNCTLKPKVENHTKRTTLAGETSEIGWRVAQLDRADAGIISTYEGYSAFGGTPNDVSVYQAILDLKSRGFEVLFYPFIIMDVEAGNTLPDPYSDNAATVGQPVYPWRGRITCSPAAGYVGSVDKTATARTQVDAFLGTADASEFSGSNGAVTYSGAAEWGFKRFTLHMAELCRQAGGVDYFIVGTEMVGASTIRDENNDFPFVEGLIDLAAEVSVLLPSAQIGYAADWSEFHSHRPSDGTNDVYFHLDPLWADSNVDFIGIDNYMKLSDWRDSDDHADYGTGNDVYGRPKGESIYDLTYLKGQVAGGEDFDYFYASTADRVSQTRTTITDGTSVFDVDPSDADRTLAVSTGGGIAYADFGSGATRSQDTAFSCKVTLPSSPTDGVLFERGGSGTGMIVCIRDSGTYLRARAGSGGETVAGGGTPSTANLIVGDELISNLSQYFDDEVHEVCWDVQMGNPGQMRLWIDGDLIIDAYSSGNHTTWTGSGSGTYIGTSGSATNISGEPTTGWSAGSTGASDLSMYDQAFDWSAPSEPWVFRQKDLVNWWSNKHYNRPDGNSLIHPTDWVPESKPIIFTEYGCPAINKGTNQPNVFYDPKSSESFVPYFSSGGRDDEIQRQYIRAMMEYWSDGSNNPTSSVYAAKMVDETRMNYWSYDARPWPTFPLDGDTWADQANWQYGHWISGRIDTVYIPDLLEQLAEDYNITVDYDFSRAYGSCDGFVLQTKTSFRSAVEPLASLFLFDIIESGDTIKAVSQQESQSRATVSLDDIADAGTEEPVTFTEKPSHELPGSMTIKYLDLFNDYELAAVSQRREVVDSESEPSSDTPVVMDYSRAQQLVDKLLYSVWAKRTVSEFGLLPEFLYLEAGDVVTISTDDFEKPVRIQGIADAAFRQISGLSFDLGIFQPGGGASRTQPLTVVNVSTSPVIALMDLPVLQSTDIEYQPYAAAYVNPWPGVNVYKSITDSNYGLDSTLLAPTVIGELTDPFDVASTTDTWDYSQELKVLIYSGELESLDEQNVLNGSNAIAIENSSGGWEIVQFVTATLTGTRTYTLTKLLRGQLGTEDNMEANLAAGARIVVLESTVQQMSLGINDINREYYFQYGPADKDIGDPTYLTTQKTFTGRGLKPYSPVDVRGTGHSWDLATIRGLTPTESLSPGIVETTWGDSYRANPVVLEGSAFLPDNPGTSGVLFKHGGTSYGCIIAVYDGVFRLQFGESNDARADAYVTDDDRATLDIPLELIPFDGQEHEFILCIDPDADGGGYVRLWIDGKFMGEGREPNGNHIGSNGGSAYWTGTNPTFWAYADATEGTGPQGWEGDGTDPYLGYGTTDTLDLHNNQSVAMTGDITISWKRRTRINGDSWDQEEVPLNEAFEKYEVDVLDPTGTVVRTLTVTDATEVTYTEAQYNADGITGPFDVIVYQISETVGRGTGRRATING